MKKALMIIVICLSLAIFLVPSTSQNVSALTLSDYTLDETKDVISLLDLTIGGLSKQEVIRDNENVSVTFDFNNPNGSLVFKFKYDLIDDNTSDSNAVRIHFDVADNKWDESNTLWVRGDGTYLRKYVNSSFTYNKKPALSKGIHEIEFGRIALFYNGVLTDQYFVYYKVDGVEIDSTINPYDLSKMNGEMFINFSVGNTQNKIYDINHIDGPFEIPDRISVSDLEKDGATIGEVIKLDEHHKYTYKASAPHKSIVFSFIYDAKDYSSIDCQFHFYNTWLSSTNGGIIWLRNDKNRISKEGGGYLEVSPFTKNGLYKIELCCLYCESGANAGKYYLSLTIDGIKKIECIVSSMPEYAGVFTTGTNSDYLYDINYMPIELNSSLYLYKYDVRKSGIEFSAELRKDIADINGISEVGFVVYPLDSPNEETQVVAKLVNSSSLYRAKVAIASLSQENIVRKYAAKAYYKKANERGNIEMHYSKIIVSSFYDELDDLSGLNSHDREILNEIKENVLNVKIDEDDCTITGASKSGDFSSSSIVITGSNSSYQSFVLNGDVLSNGDLIKIGYRFYLVSLGTNTITLSKQERKIMFGGSEHFVELNSGHDELMTAPNLSPMATNLGLKTIRLDLSLSDLFRVSSTNELIINYAYVQKFQAVLDELKNNGGIVDFLAVLWTVLPYGYKSWDDKPWGSKIAPDPYTDSANYLLWLELNGEAARIAASLFPDIKNYETWNEAEMMCEDDGPLARPDGTNYTVTEKAKILTDLMYYYNKGIKAANPKNQLTTPSICCSQTTDNDFDVTSPQFLTALYEAITDSTPVTGYTEVDTDPNNYFDIINVHPYLGRGTNLSNWKSFMNSFHTISVNYGDGGTEIWITEFGFPFNRTSNAQSQMISVLNYANQLDFITKFYFYKIHDYTNKIDSDRWGLYDYEGNIKSVGTAVKQFIEDNS